MQRVRVLQTTPDARGAFGMVSGLRRRRDETSADRLGAALAGQPGVRRAGGAYRGA